jgi:hypothetical protein
MKTQRMQHHNNTIQGVWVCSWSGVHQTYTCVSHSCVTCMDLATLYGKQVTRGHFHMHTQREVHQYNTMQADNLSNSVDVKLHIMRLIHVQNTCSVVSGKMKMADFGLVSCPQRVHAYPQHNTTSPTHIHKGDQRKSYMVDDTHT